MSMAVIEKRVIYGIVSGIRKGLINTILAILAWGAFVICAVMLAFLNVGALVEIMAVLAEFFQLILIAVFGISFFLGFQDGSTDYETTFKSAWHVNRVNRWSVHRTEKVGGLRGMKTEKYIRKIFAIMCVIAALGYFNKTLRIIHDFYFGRYGFRPVILVLVLMIILFFILSWKLWRNDYSFSKMLNMFWIFAVILTISIFCNFYCKRIIDSRCRLGHLTGSSGEVLWKFQGHA